MEKSNLKIAIWTSIVDDLNFNIKKVINNENEYCSLDEIFSPISLESDKDVFYEEIINYYLELLTKYKIDDIDKFLKKIDFISDQFDYAQSANNNSLKRKIYTILESAEGTANDLVARCSMVNKRAVALPLPIIILKDYMLNYKIHNDDFDIVLKWIILRIAIAYLFLNDGKKG